MLTTTRAVLRFVDGEAVLWSIHPGQTLAAVTAEVGWADVKIHGPSETEPPSAEVLRIVREYDPQGFWTRRGE